MLDSELKMFEGMDLTSEEETMLNTILGSRNHDFNERIIPAYEAITTFYLAKQIERSTYKLTDDLDKNRTSLVMSINSNVNNMIQSNEKLAASNEKQAKALNCMTLFLVILTIILVIMTAIMLYQG